MISVRGQGWKEREKTQENRPYASEGAGGERERGRKGNERETENPNVEGYAAKSLLRIVDFPEPEGPDMTIGRWLSGTMAGKGESQLTLLFSTWKPFLVLFHFLSRSYLIAGREK